MYSHLPQLWVVQKLYHNVSFWLLYVRLFQYYYCSTCQFLKDKSFCCLDRSANWMQLWYDQINSNFTFWLTSGLTSKELSLDKFNFIIIELIPSDILLLVGLMWLFSEFGVISSCITKIKRILKWSIWLWRMSKLTKFVKFQENNYYVLYLISKLIKELKITCLLLSSRYIKCKE